MISITYLDLKQHIAYDVTASDKHRERLNGLKEFFRKDINSPRQYEKINTISDLLRILETRDVLSERNVQPLKEIALRMPRNRELLGTIERYECSYKPRNLPNYNASENIGEGSTQVQKPPTIDINNGISPLKKHRIYEAVIENIGPFWCILGRKLKIRECVIDEINDNYDDRYAKASKLMEFYEQRADPKNWFIVLCHALDEAKMEKLREKIQHIIMMNI